MGDFEIFAKEIYPVGRFSDNSSGYLLIEKWLEIIICSGLWQLLLAQPITQGLQERLEYCEQRNFE